jgi:CO dehydrogenase/acetyl-CoA synthase alpha subunit
MTHRQLAEKLSLPLSLVEETVEAMKSNCYLMNEQTVSEELQSEAQSEHTGQEYYTMLMALKDMQDGEVDLLIDAFVNSKSPKVLARMYKVREENLETILSSLLHRIIS